MKLRSIAVVAVVAAVGILALAEVAAARSPLHGALKIKIVQETDTGAYHRPSKWQILHCLGGYRSTVRRDWADYYFTGYTGNHFDPGCRSAGTNGLEVVKLEAGFWTDVVGFDVSSKPCYVRSNPGQPKMPWGAVDDLFRIHCPTNAFGSP